VPSPQPSLGPVKRVRVRRNSRRVAPGSTSPSRSSTRSPLTAKTTAAAAAAEGGVRAAAAIAGPGWERCALRVRAGTGFPSGRRTPAACLSTTVLHHHRPPTPARSQLRAGGVAVGLSPRNSKRARTNERADADAGGRACRRVARWPSATATAHEGVTADGAGATGAGGPAC
jgi:hypothetical protein